MGSEMCIRDSSLEAERISRPSASSRAMCRAARRRAVSVPAMRWGCLKTQPADAAGPSRRPASESVGRPVPVLGTATATAGASQPTSCAMGKASKGGGKEDRKAKKAELNREREKGRRRRQVNLDQGEVASFAKVLLAEGFEFCLLYTSPSPRDS